MIASRRESGFIGRLLLLVLIVCAGLISLVGSGGGVSIGFPPCGPPVCTDPLPPQPEVTVMPPTLTAQVGSPVTFSSRLANISGSVGYQWRRAPAGSSTYSDIPGATGPSLALASVNLADDRASYRVAVTHSAGTVFGTAQLAVTASPGIVYADGEFFDGDWSAPTVTDAGRLPTGRVDERLLTGGNPDAWRRFSGTITGAGVLPLLRSGAIYSPATSGAIYVIDHAEDCLMPQASQSAFVESALLVEQGGRLFVARHKGSCTTDQRWAGGIGRNSLAASDFDVIGGPACPVAGQSCIDFSAGAAPLRLGFRRFIIGSSNETVPHGIDNWRVTVWRR